MEVKEIMEKAVAMGACEKSQKATDWRSLAWLFFSPQGREFCSKHNYPTIEMFRAMKDDVAAHDVYVEESAFCDNRDEALVGEGSSVLRFQGTDRPYRVILMHGAKAIIHAGMYAVVKVDNISGSYEVFNDGTATVL